MKTYRLQSRTGNVVGLVVVVAVGCAPLVAAMTDVPEDTSPGVAWVTCVAWALVMSTWVWYLLTLPYAAELRDDGWLVVHRLRGDAQVVVSQIAELRFLQQSKSRELSLWVHASESRVFMQAEPRLIYAIARDIVERNPSVKVWDAGFHWPWSRPTAGGMDRLRELAGY